MARNARNQRSNPEPPVVRRRWIGWAFAAGTLLYGILGPAANRLQSHADWADPGQVWDAVYLVAGARAQDRRIAALGNWAARCPAAAGWVVLVGNDPQPGRWCRLHQTNHTCVAWAVEKLAALPVIRAHRRDDAKLTVVPGSFTGTDGEMAALAAYLRQHPELTRVALVTSRFHARRLLRRARQHAAELPVDFGIVPGLPYWENRAPWIVLGEYAKLLRDRFGLARAPLLSRGAAAARPPE